MNEKRRSNGQREIDKEKKHRHTGRGGDGKREGEEGRERGKEGRSRRVPGRCPPVPGKCN